MTVRELLAALQTLPPGARVYLDIEEYPSVEGAFEHEPDPDNPFAPPAVLLEVGASGLTEPRA